MCVHIYICKHVYKHVCILYTALLLCQYQYLPLASRINTPYWSRLALFNKITRDRAQQFSFFLVRFRVSNAKIKIIIKKTVLTIRGPDGLVLTANLEGGGGYRRRIETEDKAKVVASVWGQNYLEKRLNSTVSFKTTEAKQLGWQGIEQILHPPSH